uniref:Secreted protein n=1 Tax=Eutreptiella gymnastica TaxID=73025 RepID=A0A7S4LDW8_9EUGL
MGPTSLCVTLGHVRACACLVPRCAALPGPMAQCVWRWCVPRRDVPLAVRASLRGPVCAYASLLRVYPVSECPGRAAFFLPVLCHVSLCAVSPPNYIYTRRCVTSAGSWHGLCFPSAQEST